MRVLESADRRLTTYLDILASEVYPTLRFPVSRHHYLQRCWPVIERILRDRGKTTVVDAGCGHAYEAILFASLGAQVIGIDLRQDGFKVALKNVARFQTIFPSLNIHLINRDLFAAMRNVDPDVIWVRQAISHIHPAEEFIALAHERLNAGGLLVINDSNALNPLVLLDVTSEHWRHKRQLSWFVTDHYRDPVTNVVVPYAVERMHRPGAIRGVMRTVGFEEATLDITGFIPVTVAAKLPRLTLGIEAVLKRLPIVSHIGADYTACGVKSNSSTPPFKAAKAAV